MLGPEHPHTLTSRNNLALTLQALGDPDGARATTRWLEKLCWLAQRNEESIASADQREARRYVLEVMGR